MNTDSGFALHLTLTLLHFLWQGAVVAALAAAVTFALRRASAQSRYMVDVVALLAMAMCLPVTYAMVAHSGLTAPSSGRPANVSHGGGIAADTPVQPMQPQTRAALREIAPVANRALSAGGAAARWPRLAPLVMIAYFAGVTLMLLRLALALCGGRRLRRRSEPVSDAPILASLAAAAQALQLRFTPAIAYSKRIVVPTVVGVLRPMVLLPASLASGLTPQQIDLLLLHELAHIRRYDPLFNVLQRIVEALLFFHPAVWYVSRRITVEREHCCDDLVLRHGGDPRSYADSLLQTAALAHLPQPDLAAPATVASLRRPSDLRSRIHRLLGLPHPQVRLVRTGWLVTIGACAAIAVAMANAQPAVPLPEGGVREVLEQLQDKDWWLRKVAVQQLAEEKQEVVLLSLINALKDSDPRVQAAAAEALGKQGNPAAIKHLAAALKEEEPVRSAAAEALTHFDREKVMPLVLLAARDSDSNVQQGAVAALGRLKGPEATPALIEIALTTNYNPAANLAAFSDPEGSLALMTQAAHSPDAGRRAAAAWCLQFMNLPGGTPILAELAKDTDANVRRRALESTAQIAESTLRQSGSVPDELLAVLSAGLRDPLRSTVQMCAKRLQALGWQPTADEERAWYLVGLGLFPNTLSIGAPAVPALLHALQSNWQSDDSQSFVSNPLLIDPGIVEALSAIKDSRAVPPLIELVRAGQHLMVPREKGQSAASLIKAVGALGTFGDASATEVLIDSLKSSIPGLKEEAIDALGMLKDSRAVEPLMAQLTDSKVCGRAAISLGRIGDGRAVGPLLERLAADESKDAYIYALGMIGDPVAVKPILALATVPTGPPRNLENLIVEALANTGRMHPENNEIQEALLTLLPILQNEESTVNLAKCLGDLRVEAAAMPIAEMVLKDNQINPTQWKELFDAVAKIGGPAGANALAFIVGDENGRAYSYFNTGKETFCRADLAAQALGSITDQRATDVMAELVASDGMRGKTPAIHLATALAERGDARAKAALEQLSKAGNVETMRKAKELLDKYYPAVESQPAPEPTPAPATPEEVPQTEATQVEPEAAPAAP